jgi:uncharacterized protein
VRTTVEPYRGIGGDFMKTAGTIVGLILLSLTGSNLAIAQGTATLNAETMTAARELVAAMRFDSQFKAVLPTIFQTMRPALVQGRSKQYEEVFDATVPVLVELFGSRGGEMTDQVAEVYGRTFTVDEMRQITAFYRTPAGQKLLEKQPAVFQQTAALGQAFGLKLQNEIREKVADELRKRGLDPVSGNRVKP